MSVAHIADLLKNRFGFSFTEDQVTETGRTETSTLYTAVDDKGQAVELELFDAPVDPSVGEDSHTLNSRLALAEHPGAFQPRSVGTTEDNRLYVLREAPVGTPLSELIESKGATFTEDEVRSLLGPVAAAIDDYDLKGLSGFVTRSISPERLLVQPQWSSTPVKMTLVGPSVDAAATTDELETAAQNVEKFAGIVSLMTGQPPRETKTCEGVLGEAPVVDKHEPQESAVAPRPQDGYRKPPEPYAYGPDGNYARPAEAKAKRNPWPWVIAVLAILLIALAALWYWWANRGEEWTGAEQQIAEAYPNVVSKKDGMKGWKDLKCEYGTPDTYQEGKIRCADENLGVSVVKYASQFDRDDAVPGSEYATVLGSGECTINSYELPDADPPAFVMTPQDKPEYLFIVNGYESEQQRLDLPVCE